MARNQISYVPQFKSYLENMPKLLTTILGKIIPRNLMKEQPYQVSLTTEIGGSEEFSVGILQPFMNHRANQNVPPINQPFPTPTK